MVIPVLENPVRETLTLEKRLPVKRVFILGYPQGQNLHKL
jgi:hypothetical protein